MIGCNDRQRSSTTGRRATSHARWPSVWSRHARRTRPDPRCLGTPSPTGPRVQELGFVPGQLLATVTWQASVPRGGDRGGRAARHRGWAMVVDPVRQGDLRRSGIPPCRRDSSPSSPAARSCWPTSSPSFPVWSQLGRRHPYCSELRRRTDRRAGASSHRRSERYRRSTLWWG